MPAETNKETQNTQNSPLNNDLLAQALEKLSMVVDRQTPMNAPAAPDMVRNFAMPQGGEFLVNHVWVNCDGVPIKVSAEKQAEADRSKKMYLYQQQKLHNAANGAEVEFA